MNVSICESTSSSDAFVCLEANSSLQEPSKLQKALVKTLVWIKGNINGSLQTVLTGNVIGKTAS